MTWQEGVAAVVIIAGLGAGAFLVSQRPSFWIEFGARLVRAIMPRVIQIVAAPEDEATRKARQLCERQGRRWNHAKRRCE